ncbi:hypothetical protein DFO77_12243 [Marinilabilia salmonicolor]|jgi:hypothetical protein|uniref:Uncharacterized protein n=2 Tax=Marinilabilia salmonicolor TaxID=989 RepID=A0A368UNW5_9BACT|nr:hypothetical protein DFO77_12243 [Marinilabilia salmonicolor]
MICKCNKQIVGFLIGLVVPLIFSFLLFKGRYHGDLGFDDFAITMFKLQSLGKLVSVSVLPNLLIFFVAIWTERLLAARGIVIATLLYTLATVVLYFLR